MYKFTTLVYNIALTRLKVYHYVIFCVVFLTLLSRHICTLLYIFISVYICVFVSVCIDNSKQALFYLLSTNICVYLFLFFFLSLCLSVSTFSDDNETSVKTFTYRTFRVNNWTKYNQQPINGTACRVERVVIKRKIGRQSVSPTETINSYSAIAHHGKPITFNQIV